MHDYIIDFRHINKTMVALAGNKGVNLGELTRMEGINVPNGFCISTEAFQQIIAASPSVNGLLDQLSLLQPDERDKIGALSAEVRRVIEGVAIPDEINNDIIGFLCRLDEKISYAVRSSATSEDLPTASFAGQYDTYLNIIGKEEIFRHISKCWASLFTERAVMYRLQNGFGNHNVQLSVLVQQMVFPQAAGIMFTADPVTSNRKVISIDASFGLGEALVAGLVNADVYKVCNGIITDKKISVKKLAIYASPVGGTEEKKIKEETQTKQALSDEQIVQLARLGRKIEEHFGSPQDIEWCLVDDTFYIVQSRPVTTLYPIPETNDQENHVYVSVGHQQMMTDAMKPLGLSVWLLTTPRPMPVAGGRLFVDITPMLASPGSRETVVNVTLGKSDPLIKDALTTIIDRGNFIKMLPDDNKDKAAGKSDKAGSPADYRTLNDYDPAIVSALIKRSETLIATLKQNIQTKSGLDLFDFILDDIQQIKKTFSDVQSFGVIMTGMNAASWINEKMNEWLGEKNAADILAQSAPNNITSEMGLALLDVADVMRPYPEVIAYLQHVKSNNFLDELVQVVGGQETREAISDFLSKYGMRCAGEIDITTTRWSEKPATLVPVLLGNIKKFKHGAGKRKFEQGHQAALNKEEELLGRLRQLPDGERKASETKRMIDLVRNFAGYREYPKYGIVNRYFIYKQALLKEAGRLVQSGVIHKKEDIFYLGVEEFREVVHSNKIDYDVINKRKHEYQSYKKLTPPRVITSDGEIISGKYKRENLPNKALAGLAVSSGVIEGRARVILNMDHADLEDGDILVTSFTDPGWTTLFVSIKGLVTEVGGLMTHGAVIAREYGLPAVVGVENATLLIKDRQRIRVNGTEGYVEFL